MNVAEVLSGARSWAVLTGDCITLDLPDASVDAVVTDPPAGIGFMGKGWDHDKGGRAAWVAWMTERMRVAFRLLKPGGHAVVWALPRTSHWTATAVEDAGFEVRDVLTHHFGTGFPKSLDVSKAIDSAAGAVREVVGRGGWHHGTGGGSGHTTGAFAENYKPGDAQLGGTITAPATPEAAQWCGWGTALKPSSEHWILARKPLIGTVAANVLAHGTGGLNVDACRVASGGEHFRSTVNGRTGGMTAADDREGAALGMFEPGKSFEPSNNPLGRWPTNTVFSHAEGCREVGTRVASRNVETGARGSDLSKNAYGDGVNGRSTTGSAETVPAWDCAEGCPVAELDRQSGERRSACGGGTQSGINGGGGIGFNGHEASGYQTQVYSDSGGASRFFPTFRYVPKAPRAMREDGLSAAEGERGNDHPTVKHDNLMRWLVRLVTPPGGVVLDMFTGSGSTGRGALLEGCRFIGIDAEAHYVEIAEQRIAAVVPEPVAPAEPDRQVTIFDLLARAS
jgi:site-specific DNA-methyltransferase (adenine-specific)